jgi:hypothetical protein
MEQKMKKTGNPRKKSRKYKNKINAQTKHAQTRAKERYDLNFSESDIYHIKNQIQNGEAMFLEHKTNRISIFAMNLAGTNVPIAYDNQRNSVVSFLPQKYFESSDT